ncbi:MAG: cytochrome c family protein [Verrucomicrobia bacterium]|nr:cytochrome c family protein [Verrucomicrobiota bacterium]
MMRTRMFLFLLALGLWPLFLEVAKSQTFDLSYEPADIAGAGKCKECHLSEHEAWTGSSHYKTRNRLKRDPQIAKLAQEIVTRMDGWAITQDENCTKCHFTMKATSPGEAPEEVSGVSCELCHHPSKNWLNTHNALGDFKIPYTRAAHQSKLSDPSAEPLAHKKERIKEATDKGMKSLGLLYDFARSCLECHTVPVEKLVNVGGHKAGSDFEFVAWSQGEVRHNFLRDEAVNYIRPFEQLYAMYVIGRIVDLNMAMVGLSEATTDGTYAREMAKRALHARNAIVRIINADPSKDKPRVDIPELEKIVAMVPTRHMYNNRDAYLALAKDIEASGRGLESKQDEYKAELAKVRSLLPLRMRGEAIKDRAKAF